MMNTKNNQRHPIVLAFALMMFGSFAIGQVSEKAQTLKLNKPIQREIKGGETHTLQLELKKGEYARAEVEQKDVDVIVSLQDADGKLVVEMDGKDGRLWREAISYIAKKSGIYQVEVKAYGTSDNMGSYIIKLAEKRLSMPNDRERLKAEAHLSNGRKFVSQSKNSEAVKEFETALMFWSEIDAEWEAITLTNLGWAYSDISNNEQAIATHLRAIKLFQITKDRIGEGKIINGLGNAYCNLGEYDKALEFYQKALLIRREIGDKLGESNTLGNLGWVFYRVKQYETARNYFETALQIRREIKYRIGEGDALYYLGQIYEDLNQNEQALNYYEQALDVYRIINDKKWEAAILINIGILYSKLEKNDLALEADKQALQIYRQLKDKQGEATALKNIGIDYDHLNNNQNALRFYKQALKLYQEIGDKTQKKYILEKIALIQFTLNNIQDALESYSQLLEVSRQLNDENVEAETLLGIGLINLILEKNLIALENFESALLLSRRIKNVETQKGALLGIGLVSFTIGKLAESLNSFQEALTLLENTDEDADLRALAHTFISFTYLFLGNNSKGLQESQKAILLWNSIKDEDLTERKNFLIGSMLMGLEQREKGQNYFQQLENRLQTMEIKLKVGVLVSLSQLYWEIGNKSKSLEFAQQTLELSRESSNLMAEAHILTLFGEMREDSGENDEALKFYRQSLVIFRNLNVKQLEAVTLTSMMSVCDNLQKPQLTIFYGKQAVNIFQQIRGNIKRLDDETQQSFLKDVDSYYRYLANVLISEGRVLEAQTVLDLLKTKEYEQIAVRRSGENSDNIPYSKAEIESIAKIEKLAALESRKIELEKIEKDKGSLPEAEQKELDKIFADIEAANKAFRESLEKLKKSEASVGDKIAEVESEKNLQRTLGKLSKELDTGAVAIYTVIGTDSEKDLDGKNVKDKTRSKFGWVILVTPVSRKAYPIDVKDLEATVFQFRNALSSDRYDPQPLAEKLYAAIFRQTSDKQKQNLEADLAKLLAQYKDKTIMWSLDGVLRYIPMAALHDGDEYLVEKYRHIVFTKESLAYFNDEDSPNWQALGLGVSEAKTVKDSLGDKDISFDAIPGTAKEINDIVKTSKEDAGFFDGTIRLNKDFTKDETISLWRRGKYPVIHIASHFSFNPVDQTASFLLIGDGKLTFADIKDKDNLFGTVDLLTISACDTAMSSNGKESEGFAYLAQSLGAKTVLASLWKVSDAGTPELMIRFYKLRSENPAMSKGEAFRQAQLSLLGNDADVKSNGNSAGKRSDLVKFDDAEINLPLFVKDAKKPFAHPHYWSAFVLIGNWK